MSGRELLHLPTRGRPNNVVRQHPKSKQTACNNTLPARYRDILLSSPNLNCSKHIYRSMVGDFWVFTCGLSNNSTRPNIQAPMSSGARVIVPLAFSNKALASAIFAVSAIYLGRLRDDAKLRELAMASYPTALGRFRSELVCMFDSRAETSQRDTLMATVLTLILFEVFLPAYIYCGQEIHPSSNYLYILSIYLPNNFHICVCTLTDHL